MEDKVHKQSESCMRPSKPQSARMSKPCSCRYGRQRTPGSFTFLQPRPPRFTGLPLTSLPACCPDLTSTLSTLLCSRVAAPVAPAAALTTCRPLAATPLLPRDVCQLPPAGTSPTTQRPLCLQHLALCDTLPRSCPLLARMDAGP